MNEIILKLAISQIKKFLKNRDARRKYRNLLAELRDAIRDEIGDS